MCDDCRTDFASGVQHFIFPSITEFSTVCVQNMHLLTFTSKQGWKVSITLVSLKVLHSYQCIISPKHRLIICWITQSEMIFGVGNPEKILRDYEFVHHTWNISLPYEMQNSFTQVKLCCWPQKWAYFENIWLLCCKEISIWD